MTGDFSYAFCCRAHNFQATLLDPPKKTGIDSVDHVLSTGFRMVYFRLSLAKSSRLVVPRLVHTPLEEHIDMQGKFRGLGPSSFGLFLVLETDQACDLTFGLGIPPKRVG